MRIPFVSALVRKFTEIKNDTFLKNVNWWFGNSRTHKSRSPFRNIVLSTIASEFSKTNFIVANKNFNGDIDYDLNYLLTVRPNSQMSPIDFKFALAYQLYEYGNAIAVPIWGKGTNGKYVIKSIQLKHMGNYAFGFGYEQKGDIIYLIIENKNTLKKEYIPYEDIIHIRLNPNDVFFGDKNVNLNPAAAYSNVIDDVIGDYSENIGAKITGTLKVGSANKSNFGGMTQLSEDQKKEKKQSLLDRIKNFGQDGILVLDDTEEFKVLDKPWNRITKDELDKLLETMYSMYGINMNVLTGKATVDEMDHFRAKTIRPLIKKVEQELTYKTLTKNKQNKGMLVKGITNPFDYIPISKVGDVAYKMSHIYMVNEIREFNGSAPIEGGDKLNMNLNFAPLKGGEGNEKGTDEDV